MKKTLIILLFVFLAISAQADMITKVISLNYISASEAQQALKPLLQPDETMSVSGNKLILEVSSKTLTKLRTVLNQLDVLPVVFNVAVHQGDADWLNRQAQNNIVYSTHSQSMAGNNQSIQVMSGKSALISMGSNVPVVSSVGLGLWQTGASYERAPVKQGFLIQPTLQGSRIKVKIRRFMAQVNRADANEIDQQQADTTTVIPQDKWVKVGSAGNADEEDSSSVSYTAGNTFKDNSTIYLKISVEKTDEISGTLSK